MKNKLSFIAAFAVCSLSVTFFNNFGNSNKNFSDLQMNNIEALSETEVITPCEISRGKSCSYTATLADGTKHKITISDMEKVFSI